MASTEDNAPVTPDTIFQAGSISKAVTAFAALRLAADGCARSSRSTVGPRRGSWVYGATAAWLIAQHSDHDVEFQRAALGLMCAAAEAGEADPTELAYLVDRVAVNSDEPQVYGTLRPFAALAWTG